MTQNTENPKKPNTLTAIDGGKVADDGGANGVAEPHGGAHDLPPVPPETQAQLDEDDALLQQLRIDVVGAVPGGKLSEGVSAIHVGKPPRDTFFRCHPGADYHPTFSVYQARAGFDQTPIAVMPHMIGYLRTIRIYPAPTKLFVIMTETNALQIVPVRLASADGSQNVYSRTLELAVHRAMREWIRVFNNPDTKGEGRGWEIFAAPEGRFPEPIWPTDSMGRLIRLAFKDAGNLIEDASHPLVKKWAGLPE
jgi:hypothetical protein